MASAKNVYLLVNGRGVRDRLLLRMLAGGYGALLDRGRYPVAVLHLRLADDALDVNVHPQKYEVRFADEKAVAGTVRQAVADGVRMAPWVSAAGVGQDTSGAKDGVRAYPLRSAPRSADLGPGAAARDVTSARGPLGAIARGGRGGAGARGAFGLRETSPRYGDPAASGFEATSPATTEVPLSDGAVPPGSLRRHRYLGQFLRTYLLFEGDGELLLLDQHAAHERVTYGGLKEALATGDVKMQRLLFPAQFPVSRQEEGVVREQETLRRCGFDVEILSGRTAAVRGVPAVLADSDPAALLRDVLNELLEGAEAESVERALDRAVATLACHSSVRAGQWLGEAEVAALLEAMDHVELSGHCPHGRPVVVRIGEGEIRRRFHRE